MVRRSRRTLEGSVRLSCRSKGWTWEGERERGKEGERGERKIERESEGER